ncbi:MAG: HAD family hydrolase [Candidatus Micrarchaeia archaeon]|jgi:HAD superfamily hydrolase (TIGR01509 family)
MALKSIVFDVDGVLVESAPAIARCLAHTLMKYSFKPPSQEKIRAHQGLGLKPWIGALLPKKSASDAALIAEMHDYAIKSYVKVYLPVMVKAAHGAQKAVEELSQKYPLAVATNNAPEVAEKLLQVAGVIQYFDTVVCPEGGLAPKPAPDTVLNALSQLKCHPKDALFVGDSASDLGAGKSAGVKTAIVDHYFNKKLEADFRISGLFELEAIAQKF